MTDINKQIEEASWDYSTYELARSGYIRGYNACLHSSRWRKVSEEQPPMETFVLIVNSDGGMRILSFNSTDIEEKLEFYCVEYWMPIPDRPICSNQL